MEAASVPKRRRGRPPKVSDAATEPNITAPVTEKRKVGRPKNAPMDELTTEQEQEDLRGKEREVIVVKKKTH